MIGYICGLGLIPQPLCHVCSNQSGRSHNDMCDTQMMMGKTPIRKKNRQYTNPNQRKIDINRSSDSLNDKELPVICIIPLIYIIADSACDELELSCGFERAHFRR